MAKVRKRTWINAQGKDCHAFVVDYVDSRGQRQRKQFQRYKESEKFRIKIEGEISKGTYRAEADRITVNKVCNAFLDHCQGRMERNERMTQKMYVVYKGHVKNHILHSEYGVGSRKLSQFTTSTVGEFRDALRNAGVTVVTTRKILATLHAALQFAIRKDWVATNVAHGVKVIGPRNEGAKKIVPPSKDALKAILEKAPADLKLKIMFAALTGLRASEQWGLKWADVDLEEGELHVRQRIDTYGNEGATKSKAGVRTVPLSDALILALKKYKLATEFKQPEDFVFANGNGNHTGHDNFIKRHYKPVLEAAKVGKYVPRDPKEKERERFRLAKEGKDSEGLQTEKFVPSINWHSLRHFAVSTWIEQGLKPKTVQTYAGHSSLSVTMDRYGHLFPSDEHKAAMDAIAGELLG